MGTIHFHGGFHVVSMTVALAVGVAGGMALQSAKHEQARSLDVTEYRVLGTGCGDSAQRTRIYAALEEDDLPGPTCARVENLDDPDRE